MAGDPLSIRVQSGAECGQDELLSFINRPNLAYEHLDWFPSTARLSKDSTLCLCYAGQIEAAISVAPETQDFAWLRFFFAQRDGNHSTNFNQLIEHAKIWLSSQSIPQLFSLATSEWLENLLLANGFYMQNRLVSLFTHRISGSDPDPDSKIVIRPMRLNDLKAVWELDQRCFAPPWQLNQLSLEKCYQLGEYVSLATLDGTLIAYQVTTRFMDNLHLARLAVHPQLRGRNIAKTLLFDLSRHFEGSHFESFSVNTQEDNLASLRLYSLMGFKQEGNLVPVYCLDLA